MTNKDKTGDQLVASMQKTKTGTVANKTAERSNTPESSPSQPPTPRSKANAAKPAVKTATNQDAKIKDMKGAYSRGCRVWPD